MMRSRMKFRILRAFKSISIALEGSCQSMVYRSVLLDNLYNRLLYILFHLIVFLYIQLLQEDNMRP